MNEERNMDCTNSTTEKEVQHTCCYCGQEAYYQFKNGKWCCSKNQASCPAIKKKSGIALSVRHKEAEEKFGNKRFQKNTSIIQQQKSQFEGEHICTYCGAYAEYRLKNGKWCCKPNGNSCPVRRKQAANKRNPDGTPKRDYKKWYANLSEETKRKVFYCKDKKSAHLKQAAILKRKYQNGELIPPFKGKHHSEEARLKIRMAIHHRVIREGRQNQANFSEKACSYIDKLNELMGWHLQHALNGGEVFVDGYYLDGYDKELNIAFEYDESKHYMDVSNNILKKRDVERMRNIHKKLNCRFFRYNEMAELLYEVKDFGSMA